MERVQKNTGKYWLYFFIALIAMLVVLFSPYGQWFWLILPFVCTNFALAMDFL
jgi:Na+-transporting NADH:ubiquinone oxidoreductase subunit NqrB